MFYKLRRPHGFTLQGKLNVHLAEANSIKVAISKGPGRGFESKVPVEIRNDVTRKPGGEASGAAAAPKRRDPLHRAAELLPPNHGPCS